MTERDATATTLDALLRARGIARYGFYLTSGEGTFLPDGGEVTSGLVVDASGSVHFFWTGWDAVRSCPTFATWQTVEPESAWLDDEEYRAALDAAGVAAVESRISRTG